MQAIAHVTSLSGQAFAVREGQEVALNKGDALLLSDSVRTGLGAKVEFHFTDGTEVSLGEVSRVELRDFGYDPSGASESSFAMHIVEGMVRTVTGEVVKLNPEGFALSSPMGTAGIRGTTIAAMVLPTSTVFMVTDMSGGKFVVVSSAFGGELIVYLPGQGVEIFNDGEARMTFLDAMPEDMREKFELLMDTMPDQRSSHDEFILLFGDSEFLTSLGADYMGNGLGMLTAGNIDVIIQMIEELGVPRDMLVPGSPVSDPSSPPLTAFWPTVFWTGTEIGDLENPSGADFWAGAVNQHHHASGLSGNDVIVVFNGNDTVFGGNGSTDTIVKVTDVMTDGNFLYGGGQELNNVTLDSDHIIVRGPSALDDPRDPAGYAHESNSLEWTAADMRGGSIYGSAATLDSIIGVGGANTIGVYGSMSGGAIYGKAHSSVNSILGNAVISILPALGGVGGAMSGGAIYGDAYSMLASSDGGDDTISIATMNGGSVYGDAYTMYNSTSGEDLFSLTSMNGGAIYGDAHSLDYGATAADVFSITTMNGGVIYGDAYTYNNTSGSGDTFDIDTMSGGTIYGDAHQITGGTGGDNEYLIGTFTGGTIVAGTGGDTIDVTTLDGVLNVRGEVESISVGSAGTNSEIRVEALNGSITVTGTGVPGKIVLDKLSSNSTVTLPAGEGTAMVSVTDLGGHLLTLEGDSDHTLYMKSLSDSASGSLKATGGAGITVDTITLDAPESVTLTAKTTTLKLVKGVDEALVTLASPDSGGVTATVAKQTGSNISLSGGNDGISLTEINVAAGATLSLKTGAGNDTISIGKLQTAADGLYKVEDGGMELTVKELRGNLESTEFGTFEITDYYSGTVTLKTPGMGLDIGNVRGGTAASPNVVASDDAGSHQVNINKMAGGYLAVGDGNRINFVVTTFTSGGLIGDAGEYTGFTITNMYDGAVYGNGIMDAPDNASYSAENITVTDGMTGGTIYGDVYGFSDAAGAAIMGGDIIHLGSMSGNAAVYGDLHSASGGVNLTRLVYGNNGIAVTALSGGAIYGNAASIQGRIYGNGMNGQGSDDIIVGGENDTGVSDATIYGDADAMGALEIGERLGPTPGGAAPGYPDGTFSDSIHIQENLATAKIYGDAATIIGISIGKFIYSVAGGGISVNGLMMDTIRVDGAVNGSAIYGDAQDMGALLFTVKHTGGWKLLGDNILSNTIETTGAVTGSSIYGNAETIGAITFQGEFKGELDLKSVMNDSIDIGGAVTGSAIYGDAESIGAITQKDITVDDGGECFFKLGDEGVGVMADSIGVWGDASNTKIYGDAASIGSISFGGGASVTLSCDSFMADTITLSGAAETVTIYGDAASIGSISYRFSGDGDRSPALFMADSITVGTLGQGSTIYGDTGDDNAIEWNVLYGYGESNPVAYAGTGDWAAGGTNADVRHEHFGCDIIRVGTLDGGKVYAGFGNDAVTVDTMVSGHVDLGAGKDTLAVYELGAAGGDSSLSISFGGQGNNGDGQKDGLYLGEVGLLGDTTITFSNVDTGAVWDKVGIDTAGWVNGDTAVWDRADANSDWTYVLENLDGHTLTFVLDGYRGGTPTDFITTGNVIYE